MEVSLLVFQCCDNITTLITREVSSSQEKQSYIRQLKPFNIFNKKTPHLFSDEEHFLEMEVDFLQPLLDIEARTALANPGEVAMT